MTLLFADGFDSISNGDFGTYGDWQWYASYTKIDSTYGRRGTNGMRFYNWSGQSPWTATPAFTPSSTLIWGTAFRTSSFTSPGHIYFRALDNGYQYYVRFSVNGQVELYNSGGLLETGTTQMQSDKWYYLEIKVTVHDTTGAYEVRINGNTDMSDTNVDTKSNATYDTVKDIYFAGVAGGNHWYFDDMYIANNIGSYVNDFLGDIRVDALMPDGAGSNTDWTPSAGANYQCVDEVDINDDTDYVSETVTTSYDTYSFDDLVPTSGTVYGVCTRMVARKADAGSRSTKTATRISTTEYDHSDTHSMSDSYLMFRDIWEENPNTASAWTISDINGAEFGVKLES